MNINNAYTFICIYAYVYTASTTNLDKSSEDHNE